VNNCRIQFALEQDSDPLVIRVFSNPFRLKGLRVEHQAVIGHFHDENIPHLRGNGPQFVARLPQSVDIHRWAETWRPPGTKHQGALENESGGIGRLRQPIEKPLHGVVLEQLIERPLVTPRAIEEPLAD
jgi:hypothetical protein